MRTLVDAEKRITVAISPGSAVTLMAFPSIILPLKWAKCVRRFPTAIQVLADLIQGNHRVGDSKDEVDVVLGHLLRDESERWVILLKGNVAIFS